MRGNIRVFGIILAAGKSERFKKSFLKIKKGTKDFKLSSKIDTDLDELDLGIDLRQPKCFIELHGKKIIEYSIEKFCKTVDFLVITTPQKDEEIFNKANEIARRYKSEGKKETKTKEILVIQGGKTRWQSFLNALRTIQELQPKGDDIIVEHDGARPLFSQNLLKKVINFANKMGSAVPFITPYETVRTVREIKKSFSRNESSKNIFLFEDEIDRTKVALIQTPQAFKYEIIEKAISFHSKGGERLEELRFTDLAGLIFSSHQKVFGINGERENIKITYFHDLKIAERIISSFLPY
jgi:2-C-methyl-D-erythritol 4-phosphate cytidylyltransferase